MSSSQKFATGMLVAVCIGGAIVGSQAYFSEPDVEVLYTLQTGSTTDNFGFVAETIGDINGDNAPDFVIGAPRDNAGGPVAGAVYVYSGANGALIRKVNGKPFNRFGFSVAGAGDVDNDGIPDYVVGAPGAPAGPAPQVGQVQVYSGATHTVLLTAQGTHHLDLFGWDVNTAGDVNGDSYPDVVVGARTENGVFLGQGSVTVISGLDAARLWKHNGEQAAAFMGAGVSGIGDVTGDGLADIAAGADGDGPLGTGRAYIFSGIDGTILHTLTPNGGTSFRFGQFFVHDAGDVDTDGVPDVYVADWPASSPTAVAPGRAYVFSGATGERVRTFAGALPNDRLGDGRGIGDINGDGHADLVIASYFSSYGALNGGRIELFSGKNGKVLRTMTGAVAGVTLGVDALGIGDVNGDGKPEILATGFGVAHVIAGR